jgi:hypothetical protein
MWSGSGPVTGSRGFQHCDHLLLSMRQPSVQINDAGFLHQPVVRRLGSSRSPSGRVDIAPPASGRKPPGLRAPSLNATSTSSAPELTRTCRRDLICLSHRQQATSPWCGVRHFMADALRGHRFHTQVSPKLKSLQVWPHDVFRPDTMHPDLGMPATAEADRTKGRWLERPRMRAAAAGCAGRLSQRNSRWAVSVVLVVGHKARICMPRH